MTTYLIDGDNRPGKQLDGIELLTAEDKIHIFYAEKNTYYSSEKRQKEVQSRTNANITYTRIKQGKNAVDFAIAIAAAECAMESYNERIFLVSADGHFDLIFDILTKRFGNECTIKRIAQIWEGAILAPNCVDSWTKAQLLLEQVLGAEGGLLFKQIRALCKENEQPKTLWQKIFARI